MRAWEDVRHLQTRLLLFAAGKLVEQAIDDMACQVAKLYDRLQLCLQKVTGLIKQTGSFQRLTCRHQ